MSYNSILGNLYTGISPSELVSRTAKNTGTNLATGLLAGVDNKALRGAMGMDSDGCSFRFGDGRGRMGMHGDMCGRYDDPLKGAMVSLGMANAAPYIAQTGSIIGGPIDSMIGSVHNGIGSAFGMVTSSISGATGISPNVIGNTLGAGASAITGGYGAVDSAASAIFGASKAISTSNSGGNIVSSVGKTASSFLSSATSSISSFF